MSSGSNRNSMGKKRSFTTKSLGDFMLIKPKIGVGSYADVYQGYKKENTDFIVAIKVISKERLTKKLIQSIQFEMDTLQSINHPNIVSLLQLQESKRHYFIFLEYCEGGDLSKYIRKRGRLPEDEAEYFMVQLARGLNYLRQRNLIHRDLKPQNLLLTKKDGKNILKIADFGFAKEVEPQDLAETLCGSPLYMAPEIMRYERYDYKVDLWSAGAILYEMVVGRPPYKGSNPLQLKQNIESSPVSFPSDISISEKCKDLIIGLLQRDPAKRMDFEQFIKHPFLNQHQHEPIPNTDSDSANSLQTTVSDNNSQNPQLNHNVNSNDNFENNNHNHITGLQFRNIPQIKQTESLLDSARSNQSNSPRISNESIPNFEKEETTTNNTTNNAATTTSSTSTSTRKSDGSVEQEYVLIDTSEDMATSMSFYLQELDGGQFKLPETIFDFSKKKCGVQADKVVELENQAKVAWIVAELAYIKAKSAQSRDAFILYVKALSILRSCYYGSKELVDSDRLQTLLDWIRKWYLKFLRRAESLDHNLSSSTTMEPAEKLLYDYALKLSKDAAVEEYWSTIETCGAKYYRSKCLFRLLMSLPGLPNNDLNILQTFYQEVEKRLASIQQKSQPAIVS